MINSHGLLVKVGLFLKKINLLVVEAKGSQMGEENDLLAINIFPQGCKLSCNLMIFHFVVVVSFDFIIAMM